MADVQFNNLQLVGYREPDNSVESNPDGTKFNVELPGVYRVGFMLGDRFMELGTFKAGNVMDAISQQEQGSQAQSQEQSGGQQSQSGDQSQSGQQQQTQ